MSSGAQPSHERSERLGEVKEPRTRTDLIQHLPRQQVENYATAVVTLRTANDSITRVTPLMIMLTPTRMPIAQKELNGHCI